MAAKKVTKDSLRATLGESGVCYIKLSKQPLVGKILNGVKITSFRTNHKAQKLGKKLNAFPDHIKYPPKEVTPNAETLIQVEEFNQILLQFQKETEKKPEVSEKTVRIRVVGFKKEGNAYLCTCNIV